MTVPAAPAPSAASHFSINPNDVNMSAYGGGGKMPGGKDQNRVLDLERENFELKSYAEKVTQQLGRYVDTHGKIGAAAVLAAAENDNAKKGVSDPYDALLPPWATNMRIMTPLLKAYEESRLPLRACLFVYKKVSSRPIGRFTVAHHKI